MISECRGGRARLTRAMLRKDPVLYASVVPTLAQKARKDGPASFFRTDCSIPNTVGAPALRAFAQGWDSTRLTPWDFCVSSQNFGVEQCWRD
jgi:hypothetical protein